MALSLGTNCGLVASSPSNDPSGEGTRTIDNYKRAVVVTTTGAVTITEMGWWCDNATEAGTYEIGIYADSSGLPGDRLYVDTGNAKGTDAGWKKVTGLDWDLDASTTYWFAVALTDTTTATSIDFGSISGTDYAYTSGATTLPDPFGSTSTIADQALAVYAVYGAAATYKLEGITKDNAGSVLGSCKCFLFKDNGDNTASFVDYQLSNASTGAYSFTGITDNDANYFVIAWKDNTPHVMDTTDHVLQPVEE